MSQHGLDFDPAAAAAIADRLRSEQDVDVLLYQGPVERPYDDAVLDLCLGNPRRSRRVLVLLATNGGDAHAAYRIARCLQERYEHFSVLVPGSCKSAGTLIVLGANQVIMAHHAELGPLDVQMALKDDLWESQSGLTLIEALDYLERRTFQSLELYFLQIKAKSANQITFKTATEVASSFVQGLFRPIYEQINPMQVGEAARAINIAYHYGDRLQRHGGNVSEGAIENLINGYSDHGFVIDRHEARDLFRELREPEGLECDLLAALGPLIRIPALRGVQEPLVTYIHDIATTHDSEDEGDGRHASPTRSDPEPTRARGGAGEDADDPVDVSGSPPETPSRGVVPIAEPRRVRRRKDEAPGSGEARA